MKKLIVPPNSGKTLTCNKGYTLVELLVVCVIISIISTIALPAFSEFRARAKVAQAASEIRDIEKSIVTYALEQNKFPITLADIGRGGMKDPWGSPYLYSDAPSMSWTSGPVNNDFDLYSSGADGASSNLITDLVTKDDIIRANEGAFLSKAQQYGVI